MGRHMLSAIFMAALSATVAASAVAQSGAARDPRSSPGYAPPYPDRSGLALQPLPSPGLTESASPEDLLRHALAAVVQNRRGEAQEAMEMAQTRLLDRSVPLGRTRDSSDSEAVRQISSARKDLSDGDRAATVQHIEDALQVLGTGTK